MATDLHNNQLSDKVYHADAGKKGRKPVKEGKLLLDGQFKVLKVEDNPTNGMQAMAVAPVVNG